LGYFTRLAADRQLAFKLNKAAWAHIDGFATALLRLYHDVTTALPYPDPDAPKTILKLRNHSIFNSSTLAVCQICITFTTINQIKRKVRNVLKEKPAAQNLLLLVNLAAKTRRQLLCNCELLNY